MSVAPMDVRTASTDTVDMYDIEKHRKSYESNREWTLRKSFLEAHRDSFPEDRLVCLSHCFINVEMYGCRYPGPVMEQLTVLIESIQDEVDEHRAFVTSKTEVKFVKSSDSTKPAVTTPSATSISSHTSSLPPVYQSVSNAPRPVTGLGKSKAPLLFVKASNDFKSTEFKQDGATNSIPPGLKTKFLSASETGATSAMDAESLTVKFIMLGKQIEAVSKSNTNVVSALHLAMDKVRMTAHCDYITHPLKAGASSPSFQCELKIDLVSVASACGNSKKEAKQRTYGLAISNLSHKFLRVIETDSNTMELQISDTHFSKVPSVSPNVQVDSNGGAVSNECPVGRKRPFPGHEELSRFLIMENFVSSSNANSITILRQSSDFNKCLLEYELSQNDADTEQTRCQVFINKILVVDCMGNSKTNAKSVASDKALEQLRQLCWTVKVKKHEDSDEAGLTREEIMGDVEKQAQVIPESNVGSLLLKKMGWTGGGVGKEGREGRATPVTVNSIINRQGLGLQEEQGISKNFVQSIRGILNDYVTSNKQDDLSFSPDFGKEERAIIHRESQKLGLKSGSKGTGEERFLIISRKRTAGQLFEHIVQKGGSTSKYDLVPPGGNAT